MILLMDLPHISDEYKFTHPDKAIAYLGREWQRVEAERQRDTENGLLKAEARFYFGLAQDLVEWRER